jgi:hypothetical protein
MACFAYPSPLKMEEVYSSETSIDFRRTTQRYIQKERNLRNHRCGNLQSLTNRVQSQTNKFRDRIHYAHLKARRNMFRLVRAS